MMKRANKRKETDADFEEKRFNLSLGQAELDRENDYYTRPAPRQWGHRPVPWPLWEAGYLDTLEGVSWYFIFFVPIYKLQCRGFYFFYL